MKKRTFQEPLVETDRVEVLSNKLLALTKELTLANQELAYTNQELAYTNQELAYANQELAQIQRERSAMLSNISHDLRAPISAIRSAVDLLLSNHPLSQTDVQTAINLIDRRTTTLQTMIQDMYLLFTLENNELSLHYETVLAVPFFEEYFYQALIDQRYEDKKMHLEISDDVNAWITIDIQQMLRVLDNLFTNAAKYSLPQAEITLSVKLSTDKNKLILQVIDTGIGIPPECLPMLFDRTYTVSFARTPESNTGSGLGLCIVKLIVEKFQGQVECESQVGKGSTFTILLPTQIGSTAL